MAAAIGRDALMFGIHPRRVAGVPKVVGTLITGSHGGPGDGFRQACREALGMRRNMPFRVGTGLEAVLTSRAIRHFVPNYRHRARTYRHRARAYRHRDRLAHGSKRQVVSSP
jgi:hypothetical protein